MRTYKNKKYENNKTHKKRIKNDNATSPSLKKLHKGYKLYGAKSYTPKEMFKYQSDLKKQHKNDCVSGSFGWFGSLEVALKYKSKDTTSSIYTFVTKTPINLININLKNQNFFKNLFSRTTNNIKPLIYIKKQDINKIKFENKYLKMTTKEKCYYEFCFCFGYISITEQYEFLKLIKYLVENNFINMARRDGSSILNKIILRISYYDVNNLLNEPNNLSINNRLSIYDLDVSAVSNLCSIIPKNIQGIYYNDRTSFWYPYIVNRTNLEEYIIFNPPLILDWKNNNNK